ncbi:MAG: hypothetical protein LUH05_06875 [Candidatus Gastranaerophilales bacterium]|nr:hypothetical protein [Candidatus Gastranaerophilales bacterium]
MQIINLTPNVTTVAKCSVKKLDGRNNECLIFKIAPEKDKDYFSSLKNHEDWQDSEFLEFIQEDMDNYDYKKGMNLYSMENTEGDCVGIMETSQEGDDTIDIEVLETSPKHRNEQQDGKSKYVGETFLSFIAKLAKNLNKNEIRLDSTDSARDFYLKKCHFDESNYNYDTLILSDDKFDKLIQQNESHTGKSIELTA